jgi:hypothetical protein
MSTGEFAGRYWLGTAANPALNPVRFALWTLRDKAAHRPSL